MSVVEPEDRETRWVTDAEMIRRLGVPERLAQMHHMDGNRPLPADRDTLGRLVREAWVRWAKTQPDPKPSWLVPYDELSEPDKEADRQIGETIARWTLVIGGLWVVGSALDGYTRLSSEKAACQRRAEKPYDYHRC